MTYNVETAEHAWLNVSKEDLDKFISNVRKYYNSRPEVRLRSERR